MQFKDQRSKLSLWSEDRLAAKVSRTLRSKSVKQKGPIYRILRSYLPIHKKTQNPHKHDIYHVRSRS